MSKCHYCKLLHLNSVESILYITDFAFQECEEDSIMSTSSVGSGADLLTFKTEGSGLCSAVQDFCCKPKQVKQPIQSPIIPQPEQEPSKMECSDLPGFQCRSDIKVSPNFCSFVNMFVV